MTWLLILPALYLLLVLLMTIFQERLIFVGAFLDQEPLPHVEGVHTESLPLNHGEGRFRIAVGEPEDPKGTVVGFCGNAEDLRSAIGWAGGLREYGFASVFVEYPGYGESSGKPSVGSFFDAAETAARYAKSLHTGGPLIAFGVSLGTCSATKVAALGLCDRTVLVAPPSSLVGVAADQYPYLPVKLFLRHRFDSLGLAPQIETPLFLLHGDQDRIVPQHHGKKLAAAWGSAVQGERPAVEFLDAKGYGHGDLRLDREGPFGDRLAAFLEAPVL